MQKAWASAIFTMMDKPEYFIIKIAPTFSTKYM